MKKVETKKITERLIQAVVILKEIKKNNEDAVKYFQDMNVQIDKFLSDVSKDFGEEDEKEKDSKGAEMTTGVLNEKNLEKAIEMMKKYKLKPPISIGAGAGIPIEKASESLKEKVLAKKAERARIMDETLGAGTHKGYGVDVPTTGGGSAPVKTESPVGKIWCSVCEEYHNSEEHSTF